MAAGDALGEAADALYALVPEEFTAARNARTAAAKAAGDPALAKGIGALRRPSPAAWIVNRIARDEPDRLGDLIGLGGELAEAQAAGDGRALTALAAERREIVADLVALGSSVADAAGRAASRAVLDEVEQTLVAASVSADAAAAVASGRLVRSLRAVGTEVDLGGAVGGGEPGRSGRPGRIRGRSTRERADDGAAATPDAAARRASDRAEQELQRLRERAATDERGLAEASARVDAAAALVDDLEAERDALERRISEVRTRLRPAEREVRIARRALEAAALEAGRSAAALAAASAAEPPDRAGP
ncbi:transposase [Agromyces marinus]|uniref:transposase n=1 Tax=Agromyces marinus TaxID=1389020 RepID=UPI001F2FD784|nr:transposase [Agromyces marinus]UIP59015.1 hypothetical protein DSM26151_19080 [Agromyces marinus]